MKWLVLVGATEAATRSAAISLAMGYPLQPTRTERATNTISHTDGRAAVGIASSVWSWVANAKIDMESLLTGDEVSSLQSVGAMDSDGWFPDEPNPWD
jgi:hypothetical protein